MKLDSLKLKARAKINLALDILYKRKDGYHEVAMIMQTLSLADNVCLREQPEGITVSSNMPWLDNGPSNLAYRAAALILETCGLRRGVYIELEKHIPLAAGLAGGSADAAAVLLGLDRLWHLGLSLAQLEELAAQLGSDVPFCLQGGTKLAAGRGEKLSSLPDMPHAWVVLAKPLLEVSTAWAYRNYRPELVEAHPDLSGMEGCLREKDLTGIAKRLGNVLETVTVPVHPEIAELKRYMVENGAMASLMSGSGPTVFALVADRLQAEKIAEGLGEITNAQIIITDTSKSWGGEDGTTATAN